MGQRKANGEGNWREMSEAGGGKRRKGEVRPSQARASAGTDRQGSQGKGKGRFRKNAAVAMGDWGAARGRLATNSGLRSGRPGYVVVEAFWWFDGLGGWRSRHGRFLSGPITEVDKGLGGTDSAETDKGENRALVCRTKSAKRRGEARDAAPDSAVVPSE